MDITSFDDLLQVARAQSEPQRLLFVFAGVELPEDATPQQRQRFEQGGGGALVPLMTVDKLPAELPDFPALAQEAAAFGPQWQIVFAAAMSGRGGAQPGSAQADAALQRMVQAIRQGLHDAFIPFDRQGHPVVFG